MPQTTVSNHLESVVPGPDPAMIQRWGVVIVYDDESLSRAQAVKDYLDAFYLNIKEKVRPGKIILRSSTEILQSILSELPPGAEEKVLPNLYNGTYIKVYLLKYNQDDLSEPIHYLEGDVTPEQIEEMANLIHRKFKKRNLVAIGFGLLGLYLAFGQKSN